LTQQPQPQKAAPQVAAVESVASSPTVSDSTSPTNSPSPSAPKLKSSIGFSWTNLREMDKRKSKMNVIPGTLGANDPNAKAKEERQTFSQQELELQWLSMCNRMPQKLSGVAARMKNLNPTITTFPEVEVVVENQLAFEQIDQIKGSITNTLKIYLHNSDIKLTIRIAEHQEQEIIMTRREQFEEMEKENPSVKKLREVFNLELA
jgi:DNA polymerase-3 subunit gamma/tau